MNPIEVMKGEEMLEGYPVRYGLDKVEFVTKRPFNDVKESLSSLRPLSSNVGAFKIKEITKDKNDSISHKNIEAYGKGYRTIIFFTNISFDLFELLKGKEAILGKPWMVELFQDIVCPTNEEAVRLSNKKINDSYLCNQDLYNHVYDSRDLTSYVSEPPKFNTEKKYDDWLWCMYKRQNKPKPEIIGNRTLYLGKGDFRYVIYARLSKTDGKPVVHSEFRFRGLNLLRKLNIRKKGTSYIETLKNETTLRSADLFNELAGQHVRMSGIDVLKLSRHYLGWSDKKKFSQHETQKIQLHALVLKRMLHLNTTSNFMRYFKEYNINYRLFVTQSS